MFRDRALLTTLGVSALFHLSMVTLFSIYVWIPIQTPQYAQLDIWDLPAGRSVLNPPSPRLQMPSFEESIAAEDTTPLSDITGALSLDQPDLAAALPDITLPSLDSAQLERSEVIGHSLRIRSAFEPAPRQDSWSRFIGGIGQLEDRLREYTPLESVFPPEVVAPKPEPFSRPASGLAMYIEWIGEPNDRELLVPAPIDSLWRLDPKSMREPITVPFKVDRQGQVTSVWLLEAEGDPLLTSIADALRNFRFAPLDAEGAGEQYGSLVIAADPSK